MWAAIRELKVFIQAGNFVKNVKKKIKIGLKINIKNCGRWLYLTQFYLRDGRRNAKYLGISHTCLFQKYSVEKTAYKSDLKKSYYFGFWSRLLWVSCLCGRFLIKMF